MYDPTKPYKVDIKKSIEKTWNVPYISVRKNTYSVFSLYEVDHTDGIGTKGVYHWKKKTFRNAVIDALAMNLNDLLLVRARPYKLQNHIVIPKENTNVLHDIMEEMVSQCIKYNIVITGGETSIHNFSHAFDISMTVSGFVKKTVPNRVRRSDVIIGIPSSGLHANGFTTVRRVFKNSYRKEFTLPTRIYFDEVFPLFDNFDIHGMMHITGGAFTKIKDILNDNDAYIYNKIHIKPHEIFFELYKKGLSNRQMYSTFNCGIGFVMTASRSEAKGILEHIKDSEIIGEVIKGTGTVHIQSSFNKRSVSF